MKKTSIVFIAGALLSLASCQSNPADTGADQATIDSAVNARVEELKTEMMMQNDSIINAEAQRRADSIVASQSVAGAPRPATRPAPSRGTSRTPQGTTKPTTGRQPTAQDEKFESHRTGDKNISEQKKQEQDDKFNQNRR